MHLDVYLVRFCTINGGEGEWPGEKLVDLMYLYNVMSGFAAKPEFLQSRIHCISS